MYLFGRDKDQTHTRSGISDAGPPLGHFILFDGGRKARRTVATKVLIHLIFLIVN